MDPRLLKAARSGDVSQLQLLARDNPNCLHGETAQKNTALHIASGLGNTSFAVDLCNRRPLLLVQTNARGDTPVHCAARAGQRFLVSFFMGSLKGVFPSGGGKEEVENLVRMRNKDGNTALHEAVRHRHAGVVIELMWVDPELGSMVNDSGESPLYLAAERASSEIVELLLQSTRTVSDGPGRKTALHAASCRSHDIAEKLLVGMPELNRQVDISSSTPLHYAASHGDLNMVQLLLQFDHTTAHICDKDGFSPVHVSASMGHVHVIDKLIEMSPDSPYVTDKRGMNFLHVAVLKKRLEVVKYILRMPLLDDLVNERDCEGNTPLHLATLNCNQEIVQILLANTRVATDVTNHKGLTPLDIASSCAKPYIVFRMNKIKGDLIWAGSQLSPQRLDIWTNNIKRNQEEEINRCRSIANNLAVMAVLIATVSFAAAFTLPGGYQNNAGPEEGMAVLGRKAAFKAFLISDTVAMVSSITITCLLVGTGSLDHDVRLHSLTTSMKLMRIATGGMIMAFTTGTYVVIPPDCQWLAILVCVIVCVGYWPVFGSFRMAKARRDQIKPAFRSLGIAKAHVDHSKNENSVVSNQGVKTFSQMKFRSRLHSITGFPTPTSSR